MLDVEDAGAKKLDSYQNFAKAFKVRDFSPLMASQKPNDARLKQRWSSRRRSSLARNSHCQRSAQFCSHFTNCKLRSIPTRSCRTFEIVSPTTAQTRGDCGTNALHRLQVGESAARRGGSSTGAHGDREERTGRGTVRDPRDSRRDKDGSARLSKGDAQGRRRYRRIAGYFRSSMFEW